MPDNAQFFQIADKLLEKRGYLVIGYKRPFTDKIGNTVYRIAQYEAPEEFQVVEDSTGEEWDRQIVELMEMATEMGFNWNRGRSARSSDLHSFYRVTYKRLAKDYKTNPVEETPTVSRKFRLPVSEKI